MEPISAPNLNSSSTLYKPPLLPECSPPFFCSISKPLIGGDNGFLVLHRFLKKRVSAHFISFSVEPLGTNSTKHFVYLSLQDSQIYTKGLRNKISHINYIGNISIIDIWNYYISHLLTNVPIW